MKRLMYVLGMLLLLVQGGCPIKAQHGPIPIPAKHYQELEKKLRRTWIASMKQVSKVIPDQEIQMQLQQLDKLLLDRQVFWVPGVGFDSTIPHKAKEGTIIIYPSTKENRKNLQGKKLFESTLKNHGLFALTGTDVILVLNCDRKPSPGEVFELYANLHRLKSYKSFFIRSDSTSDWEKHELSVTNFQAMLIRQYVGPKIWQEAVRVVQNDIDENYREKHTSKEKEVLCRIRFFKQLDFDRKMLTTPKLWAFSWDTVVIYAYLQDTEGLDEARKVARRNYLLNIFTGQD